jgi:hypothetical protein
LTGLGPSEERPEEDPQMLDADRSENAPDHIERGAPLHRQTITFEAFEAGDDEGAVSVLATEAYALVN